MKFFLIATGLICSTFVSSNVLAQAEDLISITVEGRSAKPTSAEASREITAWAQATTAREQVIEVLGEARYQKSKAAIEAKVVKESSKFMPFVNAGDITQGNDRTFKMPVTLRISMPSLRRLILDAGLLNEAGSPTSMVPLVAFTDRRKGQSVRWWLGESADAVSKDTIDNGREMSRLITTNLATKGFFVVKPSEGPDSSVPESLRAERPQGDTISGIAKHFGAALIVRGDVRLSLAKEDGEAIDGSVKMEVVHAASGRVVADTAKNFTTVGAGKELRTTLTKAVVDSTVELARQVSETWQRGTLNANSLRLAVRTDM
ncbi:MAG: hypothetical protein V4692_00630, partial [Bdellovibrionota bacterium]